MEQADPGFDPHLQQGVRHPAVEVEAALVRLPDTFGHNTRPTDRKPVGLEPGASDQRDVLVVAVTVIAGDIAVAAIADRSGPTRKGVPDAVGLPVTATFHLIG